MKGKSVKPAFRVFECAHDIAPGEALVMGAITVCRQARLYNRSFLFCQKGCCIGIIVDEEVCASSNYNRCKTFLQSTYMSE